ncbi:hypothetical protein HID58_035461, partial [Brassica napus]
MTRINQVLFFVCMLLDVCWDIVENTSDIHRNLTNGFKYIMEHEIQRGLTIHKLCKNFMILNTTEDALLHLEHRHIRAVLTLFYSEKENYYSIPRISPMVSNMLCSMKFNVKMKTNHISWTCESQVYILEIVCGFSSESGRRKYRKYVVARTSHEGKFGYGGYIVIFFEVMLVYKPTHSEKKNQHIFRNILFSSHKVFLTKVIDRAKEKIKIRSIKI